ncbi:MAG: ABC transporter permease [Ruminococcaceae bacterium]|nr:ABC transporter permease [Oscillospiraceae bacterium]
MNPFLDYLLTSIPLGMTFLFGCTGEILTEKAGHLNLGIPGIMAMGGATGCLALKFLHNTSCPPALIAIISILAAFAGGIAMGAIYSFLTVTLKANQNVTGLAMTTFGVGTTKFIMSGMATDAMQYLYALDYFRFPFAESTNALKYCGIMVYLAIIIALTASFVLTKTRVGLHLRAVGENPATADAVGINVSLYKYTATCIGSGIAALGGLFYIMDYSGSYEAYKRIEELGWLAVALVIFTLWRPHLSIIGSVLFGMLYIAGSRIPTLLGIKLDISATPLLQMLPYAVTIIVLIVTSVRKKRENQPPASLGLPYFREER